MLQFFDEQGVDPLPAGIRVTLYQPSAPIASAAGFATLLGPIVGQAYTTAGGYCNLQVQTAVPYAVTFDMSAQAPQQAVFIGTPGFPKFALFNGAVANAVTQVTVPGYCSPVLSTAGYAQTQAALWPTNWFEPEASSPGGNVYALAVLLGAIFAQADQFGEIIHGAIRLQSSTGLQIDSWVRDFFGGNLPRLQGESDASYIARVFVMFQLPLTTIPCIQAVVTSFYAALSGTLGYGFGQGQALDLVGGLDVTGGLDVSGSFTPEGSLPYIFVWDRQSQPGLANTWNINPGNDDGSVVIQVGLANSTGWNLDNANLDNNTFLIDPNQYTLSNSAPDARLGALVNFVKAGGAWPRYLTANLT
jgi:hypothetical protein